jgi:hypothetical protein
MNRTYLFITVLALLWGASAPAAGQKNFFEEKDLDPKHETLSEKERENIGYIVKRIERHQAKKISRTKRYRFAKINREVINCDSVIFNFFLDRKVTFKTKSLKRHSYKEHLKNKVTEWISDAGVVMIEDSTGYVEFIWTGYSDEYYYRSNDKSQAIWGVKVRYVSGDICIIEDLDLKIGIGCGMMYQKNEKSESFTESIEKRVENLHESGLENTSSEDSIKVLVVYTNSAYSQVNDIASKIQNWVSLSNSGFNNSQVNTKIKLVRTAMVYYNGDESDYSKLLNELTNTNDGKLDEVPRLRDAYAADFVVMVVDETEPAPTGGVNEGKTKREGNQLNSSYAYSVVWNTPTSQLTFAHEIGHLRGGEHQESIPGYAYASPYPYARAFVYGTSWRTIMAWNPLSNETRITYYSSPNVFYNGIPVGTTNANNALAFNSSSSQNLNYRIGNALLLANDTIRNREIAIASATTSIDTDNKVVIALNGSEVRFTAGSKVTLKPGFRAATGSKFVAKIGTGSTASDGLTVAPSAIVAARASATTDEEQPEKPVATESISEGSALPTEFSLFQNYPNPFNPTTTIRYALPKGAKVVLVVYDVLGRKTMELVNETKAAGFYEVSLNASRLASGTYLYRLQAGEYVETKKLVVVK